MSRKRPSVASRYLAAIDCAAVPSSLPPSVTRHEAARALSPPTSTWKEPPLQSDSFSSGKSPIQTRSTGNSPSSSRRSRASRTPPRDAAVDVSCNNISPFGRRSSFFPATTTALLGKQQQRAVPAAACVDHDTDESSLTKSSRSSTPLLCEEDDRLLETREDLRRDSPPEENWRNRLEIIANSYKRQDEIDNSYKRPDTSWIKKKAPPKQVGKSPRSSPILSSETTAPTEVTMNLSSKRRSSDAMTDVTGTSTEIITNRAVDLHRKLLKKVDGDECHPIDRLARRPQHEQQEEGARLSKKLQTTRLSPRRPIDIQGSEPPQRRPIDIKSLMSDSTNEESVGPLPIGRLGRHVRVDSKSVGSFQERSLTSSVGVELGVHTVSESSPALKRVFAQKVDAPLSPQREQEEVDQKVVCPLSPQQDSISSNPFLVRYSARGSPITERRSLYDVGSQRSTADSSDGGWTPVPLSSSGMISEDFVLDPNVTPTGKNVGPIKPLFSSDRVPSASRSPLHKLYRMEGSSEPSIDSDKVGPPDIHRVHRVTADPPLKKVPMGNPESEPDSTVISVRAKAPPETNRGMTNDNANQSIEARSSPTKLLLYRRARRQALQNQKHRRPEGEHDPNEQQLSPGEEKAGLNGAGAKLTNAVEQTRSSKSPMADTVAPRNLFPSKDVTRASKLKGGGLTHNDNAEGFDRNIGKDVNDLSDVSNEINDDRVSDQLLSNEDALTLKSSPPSCSLSVRDRIHAFTPSNYTANYIPPWASKLKGKGVINKDKQEGFDRETPVGEGAKESREAHAASGETDGEDHEENNFRKSPHNEDVNDTSALKSTPPSFSVRDRIRALSGEKSEPSRRSPINFKSIVDVRPSKRGDSTSRDGSPPGISPMFLSMGDDNQTNSGMMFHLSANRLLTGAIPLDAAPSQEMHLSDYSVKLEVGKGAKETREPYAASGGTDGDDHDKNKSWKPPHTEDVKDTYVLKSTPPSFSVRDRIRALSEGKSEPSRLTPINFKSIVDVNPSKKGDTESRDGSQPVTSTTFHSMGDDSQTNSGMTSPFSLNRFPAGAIPLDVDAAQEMLPEGSSQLDVKDHNTSRRRLVLGAHLAATVDAVSPLDRYRWRSMLADDATATDDSREISDVRSLKSFFEASMATAPSDDGGDNDDDRTVESIRSIFEPVKEEEPSAVSKMRAMFEKPKSTATNQKFSGNNAVSDAFTKFQSSAPRQSPTKSVQTSKFKSPFASPGDDVAVGASSAKHAVTKSAPSKLQTAFQSPDVSEKPEDMRDLRKSASVGKTNEFFPSDPEAMSVADRIRSLRLKQNHEKQTKPGVSEGDDASNNPSPLPSVSPRSTKGMNLVQVPETSPLIVSPQPWKQMKRSPVASEGPGEDGAVARDPKIAAESKPTFSPSADCTEKDASVKLSSGTSASYPSVIDRINVFSGNSEKKMFENKSVLKSPAKSFQRVGASQPQIASTCDGTEGDMLHLSAQALYGRKEETDNLQHELGQRYLQRRAQPTEGKVVVQDEVILQQKVHDAQQLHSGGQNGRLIRAGMIISKKPLKSESSRVSGDAGSGTGSEFDDGVTLDISIAEISQLTTPTCLHSKEGGSDSSCGDDSSVHTSCVEEQVGKGPSEASSSQPSEAMVPLIARMRFSDDGSASVLSAKGASNESLNALKWEQLTAVHETTMTPRTTKERESAWSPDDINATFPVSASHFDTAFAAGDKLWQPLQAENWETSLVFGTNWTPPTASIDPFETPTSEARLSDATPIRRNTTSNPTDRGNTYHSSPIQWEARGRPQSGGYRPSPPRKPSPINGTPFRRTHPIRYEDNREKNPSQTAGNLVEKVPRLSPPSRIHGPNSTTVSVSPRSSPLQSPDDAVANQEAAPRTRGLPPMSTGSSKHALLMSKLRSLKEARMRRNAAAGFRSVSLSERQSRRPPTGNARTSPPTSALAPFLRPSFGSPRQTRSSSITQYRDRRPEHTIDDEYSTSTNMSMDFGGHKFTESLEVD